VPQPTGAYIPAARTGPLIFTAGQLPFEAGELSQIGKVGDAVSLEEAHRAARLCVLNALAAAAAEAGGLNKIRRVVKVTGFVASAPGFNLQPLVINGASDLVGEVFGEAGLHARSAVGVAELPLDAPVEVELVAEFEG
jgi:enamine deaminase RidA (YjgF/YER057c/UK114 family)